MGQQDVLDLFVENGNEWICLQALKRKWSSVTAVLGRMSRELETRAVKVNELIMTQDSRGLRHARTTWVLYRLRPGIYEDIMKRRGGNRNDRNKTAERCGKAVY